MQVTVWTTKSCVQCDSTKKQLTKLGVRFDELALEQHPEMLEQFKELGHLSAPIVQAGESIWSGFRFDKIQALAKRLNLENR